MPPQPTGPSTSPSPPLLVERTGIRAPGPATAGRASRRVPGALAVVGSVGVAMVGAVAWLRQWVNDAGVPVRSGLVREGQRLLVVTSHPDDELAMAGTIAAASRVGAVVALVCLTHGEASRAAEVEGMVGFEQIGAERLAGIRARELAASCTALGVRDLSVGGLPDGGLAESASSGPCVRDVVAEAIAVHRPDVVLTLDDRVGLYGNADHRAGARAVLDAWGFRSPGTDPPGRSPEVYQVTLAPRLAGIAARVSPVFARAIGESPGGPPAPDVAVAIRGQWRAKRAAALAHRSQRAVLSDLQPGLGPIPAWLYYRVIDREYFARVRPAGTTGRENPGSPL